MRKKSLLKILLLIFISIVGLNSVNATVTFLSPLTNNTNKEATYQGVKRKEEIVYDIESMSISKNTLNFKGWAFLHYHNNYGGYTTAIAIKVYENGNEENNYLIKLNGTKPSDYNIASDTSDYNGKINDFYDTMCDKQDSGSTECLTEVRDADYCSEKRGSCLYYNINFNISFDLSELSAKFSDKEVKFKIIIYYNPVYDSISNQEILGYKNTEKELNNYVESDAIGVVKSSCQINGQECPKEGQKITEDYQVTFSNVAEKIKVTGTRVYIRKNPTTPIQEENKYITYYCGTESSQPSMTTAGVITYAKKREDNNTIELQKLYETYYSKTIGSQCSTGSAYHVDAVNPSDGNNYGTGYVPASFVQPDITLILKFRSVKTCKSVKENASLTCSSPEKSLTKFVDNGDCIQTFITEDGRVNVKFTQKGLLKVGLHNTYIKSGQGFSVDATYTNTITWQLVDDNGNACTTNCYEFSTGADEDKVKKELLEKILDWFASSELMTKSSATFYYYNQSSTYPYDKNKLNNKYQITLKGEWTLGDRKTNYKNKFVAPNNVNQTSGSVTVTMTYTLANAWSNINNITSEGVSHIYSNTTPSSCKDGDNVICTNDGPVYYTSLDLASTTDNKVYPVYGVFTGLNGLSYGKDATGKIWTATYTCGIECYQGYYEEGTDNLTSESGNGYQFTYREIDTSDPFPIISGSNKIVGIDTNWYLWAEAIGKQNGKTTKEEQRTSGLEEIKKRIQETYNNKPQYIVSLDTSAIKNVKNYNSNKNYINDSGYFNLRYSNFLGSTRGTSTNSQGVKIYRSNTTPNQVGYCGQKRNETLTKSTCFCSLVDIRGNCVYDGIFTGGDS